MKRIDFGEALYSVEQAPQAPNSGPRLAAALSVLFATLPSQGKLPEERTLQLEGYQHALGDVPIEALERAVEILMQREKWVPRIGEIRECAAKILRQARWKLTRSGPWADYHPEYGVTFNAEREIGWGMRHAKQLASGVSLKQLGTGEL